MKSENLFLAPKNPAVIPRVDVFGDYVTAVQKAAGHVFAVARVAFHHLIGWLEAGVVNRETLHQQGGEAGAGSSSEGVEDEEPLESCALFANPVKNQVDDLLADGVVTAGVVVGCVFLSRDQLLWVEELAVVHEDGSGDMFASSGLTEEGVEGVVSSSDGLVTGHLAVGLDAMLQAVELPACIAYLGSSLANMDGDTFTLQEQVVQLLVLFLSFVPDAVGAHLFVILLQGGHVLSGLRELPLLHPLSHVPVDEGPLGVHQVELVVEASPGLGDGGGVAQHAHGPLHLGQVSSRNHGGRLVVDAHLEACGTPVHKLDGALGFDGGDGRVDVFGDYVAAVQEAAGHVFAVARVAFHHLIGRLEAGVGDLSHSELLVIGLLCGDNRGVGRQREVDARVGHQVGLELRQVHVQGAVKAQGGGDGGDNLSNQPVEVGVGGAFDVQAQSECSRVVWVVRMELYGSTTAVDTWGAG
ncbi:hypothetical protein FQN60_006535 [Etheostoma spectabile]|uniref:Uncharacterized protein n=1 Tax=Etheostoma spectabile TaxID=54343 RepID=A0A5J5CCG5_9PERO|nr:hypothetical protein FQN60_006535 [Etheostoma spectabile]